jgi:leucine dehydrogenase
MTNNIAELPEFDNHEFVASIADESVGLKGFIAIHNTHLGPATGGTRYWHYTSELDALKDALKLSRAMTYKCALAGVPYGGGKGVLIGNGNSLKNEKFLRSYAQRINLLKGTFYTGEDVGVDQDDANRLAKYSPYIIGKKKFGGDPGPWAALGVFHALLAALKEVFGSEDLRNRTIAIQGLGKVGFGLAQLVHEKGGKVIAADIKEEAASAAARKLKNIKIVSAKEIHRQKVDVYSPNTLGAEVNERTINEFRCSIICGGANNQLKSDYYGAVLQRLGILYVPDYVANAGGLINVVAELDKRGYSKERVREKVAGIRETVNKIIALSKEKKKPTNEVADELARKIFAPSAGKASAHLRQTTKSA